METQTRSQQTPNIAGSTSRAIAWAILLFLCLRPGPVLAAPPGTAIPDEAWADRLREEILVATPVHTKLTVDARALTEAGWSPYFAFPQISVAKGQVTAFDWRSRSWRRTSLKDYLAGAAVWTPIFALSTLNDRENHNFGPRPWNNLDCHHGIRFRCLIAITEGGFDEVRWLEVDGDDQSLPADGFDVPAARSSIAWLDADTLLVASIFPGGRTGATGEPLSVKWWRRGLPIAQAPIIYEAEDGTDMVAVYSFPLGKGRIGIVQAFEGVRPAKFVVIGRDGRALDLGMPRGSVHGVTDGQLIVSLIESWSDGHDRWPAGSAISFDAALLAQGNRPRPTEIFRAGAGRALEISGTSSSVLATARAAYLAILEKGVRTLHRAERSAGRWRTEPLLSDAGKVVNLLAADAFGDVGLISVESMIDPPALQRVDAGGATPVRQGRPFFDVRGLTVERYQARAGDGEQIPYWVIRPTGIQRPLPTILHGYGASNIPLLPIYAADVGRLWLARGGAYAIAQVRGGGEYGPAWSDAGRGANRGRPVTDFIAVAEDMIARGITATRQLGILGQSDGGRLVAAAATLRPDLFAATVSRDGAVFPEIATETGGSSVFAEDLRLLKSEAGRAVADSYWPSRIFDKRRGCPNILLTSWRGDQRVSVRQSRAFVAMLRGAGCKAALFEQPGGEHSAVSPELLGTIYAFLSEKLGLTSADN